MSNEARQTVGRDKSATAAALSTVNHYNGNKQYLKIPGPLIHHSMFGLSGKVGRNDRSLYMRQREEVQAMLWKCLDCSLCRLSFTW